MKALIAAGGHATRLRPITYAMNKHVIPLANVPMIEHAIEKIVECGITEIAMNVNPGETEIQKIVGDGSRWNVRITYLEQVGGARGIAHVVGNAEEWINGDSFIFYLGDNILLGSLRPLVERFEKENLDCMLALAKVDDPTRFGVPILQGNRIVRVIEKPDIPPSPFAVCGVYVYKPIIFEAVHNLRPSARGEFEISDAHTWLINHGYDVGYTETDGWWKDTGKPDDLIEGNSFLLDLQKVSHIAADALIEDGAVIDGIVSIGSGTVIGRESVIRGPVVIGSSCEIRGATIGPHVSIGDKSVINGTKISKSLIMEGATIIGGDAIADSIIGKHVRVVPSEKSGEAHARKMLLSERTFIEW